MTDYGIVGNNPLRLTDADGNLLTFASPQEGLAEGLRAVEGLDHEQALRVMRTWVRTANGPPPEGMANGDWLDDAVYSSAISLAKPLRQSRTIRGSLLSGLSAVSAIIVEVAQTTLPHAVTASQSLDPVWPEAVRWVLITVCIAGAWMSYSARVEARREGLR